MTLIGVMYYAQVQGKHLEKVKNAQVMETPESPLLENQGSAVNPAGQTTEPSIKALHETAPKAHRFGTTLIQIILIIVLAVGFGYLFRLAGQPSVIGEILGGILLGPSFFGLVAPDLFATIFPPSSFSTLELLSQFGLCLFMFIIGMEVDISLFRRSAPTAFLVSHSAIIWPFALGILGSLVLYSHYTPAGVAFLPFALFIGISLAITAFPVLARILQERGLTKTHLGTLAITSAAINDLTAWPLLTLVVAFVNNSNPLNAVFTLLYFAAFIAVLLYVIKPLLKRAGRVYVSRENLTKNVTSMIFLLILTASLATEFIGIHALFGAFLMGAIMPGESNLKKLFVEKIEDFTMVILLPLFFAYTGLRTNIGLLNGDMISIFFLVLGLAMAGKIGGSMVAALIGGETWKNSLSLGVLMNTRGLMELIVLNIGFDLGILQGDIFTILVAVALITTVLTGPLLNLIQRLFPEKGRSTASGGKLQNVLLSFANPLMGVKLLRVLYAISPKGQKRNLTGLHISPPFSIDQKETVTLRHQSFDEIEKEAQKIGVQLDTLHRVTDAVTGEIIKQTIRLHTDLLLLGAARSFFSNKALGGKIKKILEYSACPTGVLIDSGFTEADDVLILGEPEQAKRLTDFLTDEENKWSPQKDSNYSLALITGSPGDNAGANNIYIGESELGPDFFGNYDLVICTLETWRTYENRLNKSHTTSFLILQIK